MVVAVVVATLVKTLAASSVGFVVVRSLIGTSDNYDPVFHTCCMFCPPSRSLLVLVDDNVRNLGSFLLPIVVHTVVFVVSGTVVLAANFVVVGFVETIADSAILVVVAVLVAVIAILVVLVAIFVVVAVAVVIAVVAAVVFAVVAAVVFAVVAAAIFAVAVVVACFLIVRSSLEHSSVPIVRNQVATRISVLPVLAPV